MMMIETVSNLRKANAYIVRNLGSLEGSFISKLGEKNKEKIVSTYKNALGMVGEDCEALLPRPVTNDQRKVCLIRNREALKRAIVQIEAYDEVASSDMIDEYEKIVAQSIELEKKLLAEYGSKLETYKRMRGIK